MADVTAKRGELKVVLELNQEEAENLIKYLALNSTDSDINTEPVFSALYGVQELYRSVIGFARSEYNIKWTGHLIGIKKKES